MIACGPEIFNEAGSKREASHEPLRPTSWRGFARSPIWSVWERPYGQHAMNGQSMLPTGCSNTRARRERLCAQSGGAPACRRCDGSGPTVSWQATWRVGPQAAEGERVVRSPSDPEAQPGKKRETVWLGDTVHLTETGDPPGRTEQARTCPNRMVDGQRTVASINEWDRTAAIQEHLVARDLKPAAHLVGPVMSRTTRQAREGKGVALAHVHLDWQATQATCPQGKQSQFWWKESDEITVNVAADVWTACPVHADCTDVARSGRSAPGSAAGIAGAQTGTSHARRSGTGRSAIQHRSDALAGGAPFGLAAGSLRWAGHSPVAPCLHGRSRPCGARGRSFHADASGRNTGLPLCPPPTPSSSLRFGGSLMAPRFPVSFANSVFVWVVCTARVAHGRGFPTGW
jgi:hypothetical protein